MIQKRLVYGNFSRCLKFEPRRMIENRSEKHRIVESIPFPGE